VHQSEIFEEHIGALIYALDVDLKFICVQGVSVENLFKDN